jgi:hypothetical protein
MNYKDLFADESICIRVADKEILTLLVGGEKDDAVSDLTNSVKRKMDIQEKKKRMDSTWGDQIKEEDSYICNISEKLREGVLRKVKCKEFFFWKSGKVFTMRDDTGEIIGERDITPEEMQASTNDVTLPTSEIPEEFKQKILALEDKTEKSDVQETEVEVVENPDGGSADNGETKLIEVSQDEKDEKDEK